MTFAWDLTTKEYISLHVYLSLHYNIISIRRRTKSRALNWRTRDEYWNLLSRSRPLPAERNTTAIAVSRKNKLSLRRDATSIDPTPKWVSWTSINALVTCYSCDTLSNCYLPLTYCYILQILILLIDIPLIPLHSVNPVMTLCYASSSHRYSNSWTRGCRLSESPVQWDFEQCWRDLLPQPLQAQCIYWTLHHH